jgi:hypothetical protein
MGGAVTVDDPLEKYRDDRTLYLMRDLRDLLRDRDIVVVGRRTMERWYSHGVMNSRGDIVKLRTQRIGLRHHSSCAWVIQFIRESD